MNILRNTIIALAATAVLATIESCDSTGNIGESIVGDNISVVIDSTFTVTGKSVPSGPVQSRTLTQILGRIDVPGYGRLSSTIATQFIPSTALDTAGITADNIDSLLLALRVARGGFIGDSLAPMGLTIYPLTRKLPSPIYSDFDPTDYYTTERNYGRLIYNTSTISRPDSLKKLAYNYVEIKLPQTLARDLFNAYRDHPADYSTPDAFIDRVFKGIYIDNSFGSGRIVSIGQTTMRMFYHYNYVDDKGQTTDSIVRANRIYYIVSPEVVTNNNIDLQIDPELLARAEQGACIILSPAGRDVQFTFPAREIIARFHDQPGSRKVLNSLTFSLPSASIENEAGIAPPPYLLMILRSQRDKFFAGSSLTDNITSFYGTLDETTGVYTFPSMRDYMLQLLDKDQITDDDTDFVLVPVMVNYETSQNSSSYYYGYGTSTTATVTSIIPYVVPSVAEILFDKAKIKLTYSVQE